MLTRFFHDLLHIYMRVLGTKVVSADFALGNGARKDNRLFGFAMSR